MLGRIALPGHTGQLTPVDQNIRTPRNYLQLVQKRAPKGCPLKFQSRLYAPCGHSVVAIHTLASPTSQEKLPIRRNWNKFRHAWEDFFVENDVDVLLCPVMPAAAQVKKRASKV